MSRGVLGPTAGAVGLVVLVVVLLAVGGGTTTGGRGSVAGPDQAPVGGEPFVPAHDGRDLGDRLLRVAATQLGVPYSWAGGGLVGPSRGLEAGASTVGFDCSALVRFAAYRASGGRLLVPRTADAQTRVGTPVPLDQLRPGDVISFTRPGETVAHHVGIYAGLGRMIHAPRTRARVRVESLGGAYWRSQRWRAARYVA